MTLDETITELENGIAYLDKSIFEFDNAAVVTSVLEEKMHRKRQLLRWLNDYKRLKTQEKENGTEGKC